jgi:hypothetical protein
MNAWEETMLESVGEVSGSEKASEHDEENYELNVGSDNGSVNDEENPLALLLSQATQSNNPIANLLSQATQVPGRRTSARIQGGTQLEVALHSSAQRRPWGEVDWLTIQGKIVTSHLEEVQGRQGQLQIIRSSDVEYVSEQLLLDLHHQVLVVLLIMIMLHQWSILPSSSPLE